jgi:hypothetical protein
VADLGDWGLKKGAPLEAGRKIFFVRVSLLLVFRRMDGFFEGFGLLVGFQGSWISFVADVKV